jgi:amidase
MPPITKNGMAAEQRDTATRDQNRIHWDGIFALGSIPMSEKRGTTMQRGESGGMVMVTRRGFMGVATSLAGLACLPASTWASDTADKVPLDFDACLAALQSGQLTSVALTQLCLNRIDRIDRHGPRINAVIEINPDALALATAADALRRSGTSLSPLLGMPVLLKDNIATRDRMLTSAGSLALADAPAAQDAAIVLRLRAAGAVILGKTNLSEWANIRSSRSTSGWSGRGGLTRNPHVLDRSASGSSSGSAAAVAAQLAPLAIGTETDGSIVSPASMCGIVGFKPTVGRVSRSGIIPIAHSQDSAGTLSASVRGASLLLASLCGPDPSDASTRAAPSSLDLADAFRTDGLSGARIGVARTYFSANPEVVETTVRGIDAMRRLGATIIDPIELAPPDAYAEAELEVLLTELKGDMAAYLAKFAPQSPLHDLADIVRWNRAHAGAELSYFGQELFEKALSAGAIDEEKYRSARALCLRLAGTEGLQAAFDKHRLDVIVAPTGEPAPLTDWVNGDRGGMSFSTPAAVAGFPHLTVPCGYVRELPIGMSFVGKPFSEAVLARFGYAFEQATRAWRAPKFLPSLGDQPAALPPIDD